MFPATASRALVTTVYFLSLFGYAKAAIMPLHNWLPSAMVAPTPVSALLHAVAVVKVGVFSICRVMLYAFGVDILQRYGLGLITAYIASFTILVGSVIALTKDNLKARLAYSTIAQLSYIVLGVAMLGHNGITGGLIHIPNHAFSKITLFFCAGAIMVAHRKTEISDMEGIGHQMPFTMAAFALASLSMIGVPPVAGFVSKWYLALGSMDLKSAGLLTVLLVSSILNAGYFVPVVIKAFFPRNGGAGTLQFAEASPFMVVPLFLTAVLSVAFGFYPDLFLRLIEVVK
jgi:multicomponent Na+:H+ antiporter subunit D